MSNTIFVTKPHLPPLEKFLPYLEKIWESGHLTNFGPFHNAFQLKLQEHLGVKNLSLSNNGTTALLIALKALEIKGEVITTPYTFPATTSSITWNGLKPVFVDIDVKTCNIDPSKIEAAITPKTSAILAVHCYGHPCDIDAIQDIADRHNLKVIYDAAHCFGISYKGKSILSYGDASIISFHATKVFNTIEGGAIVMKNMDDAEKCSWLQSFGMINENEIIGDGINGKLNEINSALGLLQLDEIKQAVQNRKNITDIYIKELENIDGIHLFQECISPDHNYAYFPIIITDDCDLNRDEVMDYLKQKNVHCRRYFYPLISDHECYATYRPEKSNDLQNARYTADRILCLPLYPSLSTEQARSIMTMIKEL